MRPKDSTTTCTETVVLPPVISTPSQTVKIIIGSAAASPPSIRIDASDPQNLGLTYTCSDGSGSPASPVGLATMSGSTLLFSTANANSPNTYYIEVAVSN